MSRVAATTLPRCDSDRISHCGKLAEVVVAVRKERGYTLLVFVCVADLELQASAYNTPEYTLVVRHLTGDADYVRTPLSQIAGQVVVEPEAARKERLAGERAERAAERDRSLIERARREVQRTPADWDRDCRVCMTNGLNLFGCRAIKGPGIMVITWQGEEVHAWHTEQELLAMRAQLSFARRARDARIAGQQ